MKKFTIICGHIPSGLQSEITVGASSRKEALKTIKNALGEKLWDIDNAKFMGRVRFWKIRQAVELSPPREDGPIRAVYIDDEGRRCTQFVEESDVIERY